MAVQLAFGRERSRHRTAPRYRAPDREAPRLHARHAERRRSVRRRQRLRSLLFTSLALAIPHHLRQMSLKPHPSGPRVSTTIDSMVAMNPKHAYEGFIREAAALYNVDASLIRSIMQAESAFDPFAVSRAGAMD